MGDYPTLQRQGCDAIDKPACGSVVIVDPVQRMEESLGARNNLPESSEWHHPTLRYGCRRLVSRWGAWCRLELDVQRITAQVNKNFPIRPQ